MPNQIQHQKRGAATRRQTVSSMRRGAFLAKAALKTGLHWVSAPGTGKSRGIGRFIVPQVFAQDSPVVVLDPTGGVVDNVIDKLLRLPPEVRRRVWSRVVYVDVAATDYVAPSPLYYRLSSEDTLFEIANRLPAVFKRQDPHLQSAPILGWNSLFECATYSGQIAAALGRQIDFVSDLIAQPRQYKAELRYALSEFPELALAVAYFRELMD